MDMTFLSIDGREYIEHMTGTSGALFSHFAILLRGAQSVFDRPWLVSYVIKAKDENGEFVTIEDWQNNPDNRAMNEERFNG